MKKDNLKIVLVILLLVIAIGAIVFKEVNSVTKDNLKFKKEYESINGNKSASGKTIREVNIPKNNLMEYQTAEELAKRIDNKETFVVYFGFAECPWCRSVIETLISTAKENNINKIYYVDVLEIRDIYELNDNNELSLSREGSKGYKKLLKQIGSVLEDYTLTTEDGESVKVGEKRIYAPNVVAVVNGKAKLLKTGISELETDPYMELTNSMLKDTRKQFKEVFKYMK